MLKKHLNEPQEFWTKVLWADGLEDCTRVKVWIKEGNAHDPKRTASSVKHGGGGVMAWACTAASGTDSCLPSLPRSLFPMCKFPFTSCLTLSHCCAVPFPCRRSSALHICSSPGFPSRLSALWFLAPPSTSCLFLSLTFSAFCSFPFARRLQGFSALQFGLFVPHALFLWVPVYLAIILLVRWFRFPVFLFTSHCAPVMLLLIDRFHSSGSAGVFISLIHVT